MDFELPPQHASFRDSARELAQSVAAPFAAEVDRDHRFPDEAVTAASEAGLLGVLIPREYGGARPPSPPLHPLPRQPPPAMSATPAPLPPPPRRRRPPAPLSAD